MHSMQIDFKWAMLPRYTTSDLRNVASQRFNRESKVAKKRATVLHFTIMQAKLLKREIHNFATYICVGGGSSFVSYSKLLLGWRKNVSLFGWDWEIFRC